MAKMGRYDLCRCGSGQKYKRCYLTRDDAAATERAAAQRAAAARAREAERSVPRAKLIAEDDDGLDEASNGVIDLIDAGRLDEAEQAAHDFLRRYPQVHDGLERLAMVYAAARGNRAVRPSTTARRRTSSSRTVIRTTLQCTPIYESGPPRSTRRSGEWSGGQAT
jgi:hypothetical protein